MPKKLPSYTVKLAVPEGTQWVATEPDGAVSFFADKPHAAKKGEGWVSQHGPLLRYFTGFPCRKWKDSLHKFPNGGSK